MRKLNIYGGIFLFIKIKIDTVCSPFTSPFNPTYFLSLFFPILMKHCALPTPHFLIWGLSAEQSWMALNFPSHIASRLGFSSPLKTCTTFTMPNTLPAGLFPALQRPQCVGFTHGWQWLSPTNTQTYWNSECKILLFFKWVDGGAQ